MSNLENQIKQLIIDSLVWKTLPLPTSAAKIRFSATTAWVWIRLMHWNLVWSYKKTFGFQLDGENDNLRENFANVKTLAEFVKSRQA